MDILEVEIEELIEELFREEGMDGLIGRGLYLDKHQITHIHRQFTLSTVGIIDILLISMDATHSSRHLYYDIIELKRGKLTYNDAGQLARYHRNLEYSLKKMDVSKRTSYSVSSHLIGKQIDLSSDFCYLTDLNEEMQIYTMELDHRVGLVFNERSGWYRTNADFEKINTTLLSVAKNMLRVIDKKPEWYNA